MVRNMREESNLIILHREPECRPLEKTGIESRRTRVVLYTHRFPSTTSTRSSAVAPGSRMAISALLILYSLRMALISSWSMCVRGTVFVIAIPPFSFLRTRMAGGRLFSLMPKPSSSASMIFLSPRGFRTSRTIKMRLQVRATDVDV